MDNLYLTGPNGSQLNMGSWLRADQPIDFGAHDVVVQEYVQNAVAEGGVFAFEREPIRRMRFPLLVASGAAGLSLDGAEAWLRTLARPGGYIDLQPDGVATAEMVRFDILGGRVQHDGYSVHLQRVDRRMLAVELDTQPFGYWPTWITLASTAVKAAPFRLLVRAASVIGDAPALARLMLQASGPALASGPPGSYGPDYFAWSIGGHPSLSPSVMPAASGTFPVGGAGTYSSDAFASQIAGGPTVAVLFFAAGASLGYFGRPGVGQGPDWFSPVASHLNVRGRHRLYAWMKLTPSGAQPIQVIADTYWSNNYMPLASANQIATVVPAVASGPSGGMAWGMQPSSAYVLYDLGEMTFPRIAEASAIESFGVGGIRLFAQQPSAGATAVLNIAGFYLLPVEGPVGVITRGFGSPTDGIGINGGLNSRLDLDAARRSAAIKFNSILWDPDTQPPVLSALVNYRGGFPMLGASDTNVNVLIESRRLGAVSIDPPIHSTAGHVVDVALTYRPRFQFLKGL